MRPSRLSFKRIFELLEFEFGFKKKHFDSGKFEFRFLNNILSQESLSLDFEKNRESGKF